MKDKKKKKNPRYGSLNHAEPNKIFLYISLSNMPSAPMQ